MKTLKEKMLLSLVLLALFSLAPSQASAVFGVGDVGLFDIPAMQLDALDFVDNVVMRALIVGLLLFVESQILVMIAAGLLGWAVNLPIPLDSSLVNAGWTYMVGIVNLILLIIFVVIAFLSILRLDTFQMRKSLPRLIVVALLVNFSLLFVGIFVDIAQVFMNTIKDNLGSFWEAAIAPIKAAWAGPLAVGATALGLKLGLTLVPIGNVASAVATGALFIADLALGKGWFLQAVVLTVINFVLAFTFLIFAFLFLARTAVLALLAIVSPLALAAAILPGTQKYWNQWFHALISWSFLGIISLFLMGLGMRLFAETVHPIAPSVKGLDGGFLGNIYLYVFLAVYLVITFVVSRKLTAVGAEAIISQTTAVAKKVGGAGGALLKEGLQKDLMRARAKSEELKAKMATPGQTLSTREKITLRTTSVGNAAGRWAYRGIYKTSPEAAVERDLDKRVKEFEEKFGKDVEGAAATFGKRMMSAGDKAALGLYLAKTKGLEGLNKLGATDPERLEKQRDIIRATAAYNPKKLEDIIKHNTRLIDDEDPIDPKKGVGKLIIDKMVAKGMNDADAQKLRVLRPTATVEQILRGATYKKALDAMTPTDLENADKAIMNDPSFREAIVRWKPWNFIRKIGEEWGADMIDRLQETAEQEIAGATLEERLSSIAETNPGFLRTAYTPQGTMFMRPWRDATTNREYDKHGMDDLIRAAQASARTRGAGTTGGPGGTSPGGGYTGGTGPTGGTPPPPGPPPPSGGYTGGTGPTSP